MKRWNQRTRILDAWVERKRRFQKMFAERIRLGTGALVPAVATVPAPETPRRPVVRGEE